MGARDYSTTAASNLSVGGISLAEGMARSSVNNAMRSTMADTANLLLDLGGATATTGSGNAYLLALPSAPTAYAENLFCLVRFHATNTGAATLNVNGIGTKDIKKFSPGSGTPVATEATDIRTGRVGMLVYLATPNAFILLNPGDYATLDEDGLIEQDTQFTHPDPPSALPRPWVNRGREMCSPFDIITNPDDQDEILSGAGTFDATTQLQEAFLWAKRVEFPGGKQSPPCFLISDSIRLQHNQMLKGNGCRITIPDTGWVSDGTTDHYGMFNAKLCNHWHIEGFHFHHPPTVATLNAGGATPKAVYFEDGTDGWVVNNLFQGIKYETIWGGGTIASCLRMHFDHNSFVDCSLGGPDWPNGLPVIQLNCMDSTAIGNTFTRPGMAIAVSGARNVVVGNSVEDPYSVGIGTGDNYSNESVIVGNRIRIFSHATIQRRGLMINDGVSTPAYGSLSLFEGNYIHIVGTHGDVGVQGVYVASRLSSIGKNIITGTGEFVGVLLAGRTEFPQQIDIDGLTIRSLAETGASGGVVAAGFSAGVNMTIRLRNCTVSGLGGLEHFPYDTQTANFTVGATLTGPSATATITSVDDAGTTGTLYFRNRSGTFTTGETITDSSGGSARVANVTATSSNAYAISGTAPAVINGYLDHCWKTGGLLTWNGVQYASNLYNNVPLISVATQMIPP